MPACEHHEDVAVALTYAKLALSKAQASNGRCDCLNVAVQALEGALRNIDAEVGHTARVPPLRAVPMVVLYSRDVAEGVCAFHSVGYDRFTP